MNKEEKKNELIRIRNELSKVFNDSKEDWCDKWWCTNLCTVLGELDVTISKIGQDKPKGIGSQC